MVSWIAMVKSLKFNMFTALNPLYVKYIFFQESWASDLLFGLNIFYFKPFSWHAHDTV